MCTVVGESTSRAGKIPVADINKIQRIRLRLLATLPKQLWQYTTDDGGLKLDGVQNLSLVSPTSVFSGDFY